MAAKKASPGKGLKADKSIKPRRDKACRLMAAANISDYRVRRILECYAGWMTVAQASAELDISHVTIGRIFTLIRQRLITAKVFDTLEDRANDLIDRENDDGPYFDRSAFEEPIQRRVGEKRGVADANRALYEAEALFREQNPAMNGAPFMQLLLHVIKDTGPLDRPPRRPLSMSALALSFRAFKGDTEKMVRRKMREAESGSDAESVGNWQAIAKSMKQIEEGMFELRDESNRAFDDQGADWQSQDVSMTPSLQHRPAAMIVADNAEEAGQASAVYVDDEYEPLEAFSAEEPVLKVGKARARWYEIIAIARHDLAELKAKNTGTSREGFEIERMKLFINFCGRFADEPGLIHSPAAAALDEQFAIDELALAKRFGIAE